VRRLHRPGRRRRQGGRVGVELRPARPGEESALTALALRSKAHWGHDAAFIERARPELTLEPGDVERLVVRVAERDGAPVGFSALDLRGDPPELVALFVEPHAIGTGAGRALLADARRRAAAAGVARLTIESDPDAEPFYLSQGAERIGERVSRSTGRTLPLLRMDTG
jgi:GNAT superfamily N-acetyltransferase